LRHFIFNLSKIKSRWATNLIKEIMAITTNTIPKETSRLSRSISGTNRSRALLQEVRLEVNLWLLHLKALYKSQTLSPEEKRVI
jgi:hypothetical protein